MQFSTTKIGVNFFWAISKPRGGSEGGLAKDQTFSGFSFLHPSLICIYVWYIIHNLHISKNLPNVHVTYNIIIRCIKCVNIKDSFHKLSSLDISSSPWEKLFRKPRLDPRPLEKGHRPQTELCQHSHMSGNICIAIVIILLYVHLFPQSFKYLKLKQTGVSLSSRILFSNKRICRKRHFSKNHFVKGF